MTRTVRMLALAAMALATGAHTVPCRAVEPAPSNFAGRLEFDGSSAYSHIRIRRAGNLRSMLFVRDSGEEVIETQVDLRKPHVLRFDYLRSMFASYLVRDKQEDVLIVGLGGGAMIHFLRHVDPQVRIDAVEIDPLVVRLADEYFGVKSGDNVSIVTADGVEFIAHAQKQYDAIYMDAFLKPSATTDSTGAPLELRTKAFYQQMQKCLKPGGTVMFNLNPHEEVEADLRGIAGVFPQAYAFVLPRGEGMVVAASTIADRLSLADLVERGRALDKHFDAAFTFQDMARRLRRD